MPFKDISCPRYKFSQISQMSDENVKLFLSGYLPDTEAGPFYYLPHFLKTYPNFSEWLKNKVFPDILKFSSQRNIIFLIELKSNLIVGFAILKDTVQEKKICSFYIRPDYRFKGYGSVLMKECINFLNPYNLIIITVSEYYKDSFATFLQKFNFQCISRLPNMYVSGVTEYIFSKHN